MSRRRVRRQQPDWTITFDSDREPSAWLREAAAARYAAAAVPAEVDRSNAVGDGRPS